MGSTKKWLESLKQPHAALYNLVLFIGGLIIGSYVVYAYNNDPRGIGIIFIMAYWVVVVLVAAVYFHLVELRKTARKAVLILTRVLEQVTQGQEKLTEKKEDEPDEELDL